MISATKVFFPAALPSLTAVMSHVIFSPLKPNPPGCKIAVLPTVGSKTVITGVGFWPPPPGGVVPMVVEALAVLFALLGSVVVVVAEAVFLMTVPLAVPVVTWTTMVKVAVAPEASVGLMKVIVPVPPTGGVVVVQPPGAVAETKVGWAGPCPARLRLWRLLGRLLWGST